METEAFGHRRRAFQFLPAGPRRREAQAPHTVPAGGLPGLGLELAVELGGVTHEPRQIAAAAQLADQAGSVPRRAVRELQPLEQHDIALAALGEVIGDAAADHAAADDDDAAPTGDCHADDAPRCGTAWRHNAPP